MFANLRIIMQASQINPMQVCYVQTSGYETWAHICLVHLDNDGAIMLLDEAQMVIDFDGEITTLRPLTEIWHGYNENQYMQSYRVSTKGMYK